MIRREAGSGGVSPTVYLPLAGGTMVGNVIYNDNVSVLLGTGSDGNLYHDGTNTYFKNNTGGIVIENDAVDGGITFKVNDGGVDTTVMTIDGATSSVGIGTTSPAVKLHIVGGDMLIRSAGGNNKFYVSGGTSDGANGELYLYDGTQAWPVKLSSSGVSYLNGGNVGIGLVAPLAKTHIDQSSTTGAIPVLTVDQADVSEEFIRFIGTSANGVLTQSVVEAADVGTATIAGYLKIYVQDDGNQLTDQPYFVPIYTLA